MEKCLVSCKSQRECRLGVWTVLNHLHWESKASEQRAAVANQTLCIFVCVSVSIFAILRLAERAKCSWIDRPLRWQNDKSDNRPLSLSLDRLRAAQPLTQSRRTPSREKAQHPATTVGKIIIVKNRNNDSLGKFVISTNLESYAMIHRPRQLCFSLFFAQMPATIVILWDLSTFYRFLSQHTQTMLRAETIVRRTISQEFFYLLPQETQ